MGNTVFEWLAGNWEFLTTVIVFFAYHKYEKAQRKASAKEAEGNAVSIMQGTYATFTKDFDDKYDELKSRLSEMEKDKDLMEKSLKTRIAELGKELESYKEQAKIDKKTIDDLTEKVNRYEKELEQYKLDITKIKRK